MNRISISINANVIWHILCNSDEEMSILDLIKISGLSVEDIYTAIGWLAREDKILFEKKDDVIDYYKSQRYYF